MNITVGNLLRGAKATVMADLLERAGFDWVLDGRQPTGEEIAELGIVGLMTVCICSIKPA